MRVRTGVGIAAVAVAAVCIPVGAALAPSHSDPPAPAASPVDAPTTPAAEAFPADPQTATRVLADPAITELSGLAASRLHPGVLYGINDSGGDPVVFAIDASGATVAELTIPGITARDWEALAPGWDADGGPTLWIGEIGDNKGNQDRVRLIEIAEPAELVDQEVEFNEFWITYADGPHNAEALLVDPRDGAISIATKSSTGGGLYRLDGRPSQRGTNVLEYAMPVPATITDGGWELSATGEPRLVLTGYFDIYRWTGDTWVSKRGPWQLQREALAWPWLPGGETSDLVLLGSEGANSQIATDSVP